MLDAGLVLPGIPRMPQCYMQDQLEKLHLPRLPRVPEVLGCGLINRAKGSQMNNEGHARLLSSSIKGEFMVSQSQRRKAILEFREWKSELVRMIKEGAALVFGPDGAYQFVLPPRLVKLVWDTTIKERVRMERKQGEGAEVRAIDALRQEVNETVARELKDERNTTAVADKEGHDAGGMLPGSAPGDAGG